MPNVDRPEQSLGRGITTGSQHETDRNGALPATKPAGRAIVVCDQWLGSNGYAGMKALRRAGWDVVVIPEWEFVPSKWRSAPARAIGRLIRRVAVREFNQELEMQARLHAPEFFLAFKGSYVQADTIARLRSSGVRTYCFCPDNSFLAHGGYLPQALPRYDWVFTAKTFGVTDMRNQLGVTRSSVLLHGFDPDLHRPVPLTLDDEIRYGCDVSFIGAWSPKKEHILATLRRNRPSLQVRVWGPLWNRAVAPELRAAIGGQKVEGEQYVRALLSSKINLAILSEQRLGASSGDLITSRTFHIPATGAFMAHERTPEVTALFREDVDCAFFDGPDELAAKVDAYLADDEQRIRVAHSGHALVRSRDSWDHRVRHILARHRALVT